MSDERANLPRVPEAQRGVTEGHAPFLRAIYESPDDDAARLVYADWLLEHGDPRGEFIELQFLRRDGNAREASRENELLEAHGLDWLGPLARPVEPATVVFERGFASECQLVRRCPSEAFCIGEPAWATVRALDCSFVLGPLVELVTHPVMRSLRVLRSLRAEEALELCQRQEPLELEELEVDIYALPGFNKEFREAVGDPRCLPNLRRLGLTRVPYRAEVYDWFLRSPVAARLDTLALSSVEWNLDEWMATLAKGDWEFPRVVILFYEATATFTRGQDGRFSRLHLSLADQRREGVEKLAEVLGHMPTDALDAFVIDGGSEDQRQALTGAVRRQARLRNDL